MTISKLNRSLLLLIIYFIISNCKYEKSECDKYVASGNGFLISFKNYSKIDLKNLKISYREFIIEPKFDKASFYPYLENKNLSIKNKILLKDTLYINIEDKKLKIYDFKNAIDEGYDEEHNKIKVCRVATAKINGIELNDQNNNLIVVDFNNL
ncbi:MAG TPA: hypothetical protein VF677_01960 [Flavobacterium sp.]|jgi:hypothetical protein